jgi:hypothetical protein
MDLSEYNLPHMCPIHAPAGKACRHMADKNDITGEKRQMIHRPQPLLRRNLLISSAFQHRGFTSR